MLGLFILSSDIRWKKIHSKIAIMSCYAVKEVLLAATLLGESLSIMCCAFDTVLMVLTMT